MFGTYRIVFMMLLACGLIGFVLPRKKWTEKSIGQRMSLGAQLLTVPIAVAALSLVLLLDRRAAAREECWEVLREVIPDFGNATTMVLVALGCATAGLLFGAVHAMLPNDAVRVRRWTAASTISAAFLSAAALPGALYQMLIADNAMRICA